MHVMFFNNLFPCPYLINQLCSFKYLYASLRWFLLNITVYFFYITTLFSPHLILLVIHTHLEHESQQPKNYNSSKISNNLFISLIPTVWQDERSNGKNFWAFWRAVARPFVSPKRVYISGTPL